MRRIINPLKHFFKNKKQNPVLFMPMLRSASGVF